MHILHTCMLGFNCEKKKKYNSMSLNCRMEPHIIWRESSSSSATLSSAPASSLPDNQHVRFLLPRARVTKIYTSLLSSPVVSIGFTCIINFHTFRFCSTDRANSNGTLLNVPTVPMNVQVAWLVSLHYLVLANTKTLHLRRESGPWFLWRSDGRLMAWKKIIYTHSCLVSLCMCTTMCVIIFQQLMWLSS